MQNRRIAKAVLDKKHAAKFCAICAWDACAVRGQKNTGRHIACRPAAGLHGSVFFRIKGVQPVLQMLDQTADMQPVHK